MTWHVQKALVVLASVGLAGTCLLQAQPQGDLEPYQKVAGRIIQEARSSTAAWDRLAEFTDRFGARLSGSQALADAIRWAAEQMRKDGLDNVRTEPVMVPHWERGLESAEMMEPSRQSIVLTGLGGSVGTPPEGIEAEVAVVHSFDELDALGERVKGKIVVYNVPFRSDIDPGKAYDEVVRYRSGGASRAAKYTAAAMFLRSAGPTAHRTPHTGGMRYDPKLPQIPGAAISAEDADKLQRLQDRGIRTVVRLKMGAQMLPDVESANVVAELRGRERPDEIVLLGAHIDSWDLASGASDDGAGCVATWEAMRVLKKLNLVPRRTLRLVLFTNEENGLRGGRTYAETHQGEVANHVLALESDNGVFHPLGFGFTGTDQARAAVRRIESLLSAIGVSGLADSADAPDLGPLGRLKVPTMSLDADMLQYFVLHHTPADTVDKIDPQDIASAVAALATMAYVVADMPARLGQ
jgi:carboxypeptidase Q